MIKGKNIALRTMKSSDAKALAKHANDRALWLNVRDAIPHPYTVKDAKAFIKIAQSAENVDLTFAIDLEGESIGCISAEAKTDINRFSMELGYWISRKYRGFGYTSEAVSLMLKYLFQRFEINRIYSYVFEHNLSSRKVLKKNGFKEDALLTQSAFKDGLFVNEYIYSILKPDWINQNE